MIARTPTRPAVADAPTIDDPAYFDRLAEVESAHWWSRGMWRIAAAWLEDAACGRRGLHALDVGCGTGQGAVRLSRRPEIATVVGVDPSPLALQHARRRHGFPLVLGSALSLPFEDRRFDVVTCFDVVQHLPQGTLAAAARELRRVLRPGGFALLRSNTAPDGTSNPGIDPLRRAVAASGFEVRRATYANCLPALVVELRGWLRGAVQDRNLRGHPCGGGLRIQLPRPWVNRLMGVISAAEAMVAGRLAVRLPYGHSTLLLARATT
jgi:SAM-dependent methyltransferase